MLKEFWNFACERQNIFYKKLTQGKTIDELIENKEIYDYVLVTYYNNIIKAETKTETLQMNNPESNESYVNRVISFFILKFTDQYTTVDLINEMEDITTNISYDANKNEITYSIIQEFTEEYYDEYDEELKLIYNKNEIKIVVDAKTLFFKRMEISLRYVENEDYHIQEAIINYNYNYSSINIEELSESNNNTSERYQFMGLLNNYQNQGFYSMFTNYLAPQPNND